MKTLLITIGILVITAISFHFVSDHYRYDFYNWAIHFEESKANLADKKIEVNGQTISYLENPYIKGQVTIIMLHGFGASKENWLRFSVPFAKNYHVVAVDLLGHGENKRDLNQSYRIENQVEFVNQFAKKLNIDRFHIVGNSMGGAIAAMYASVYPQKIMSVVLVSPAGIHDIPSKMDELLKTGVNPLIATSVESFDALLNFVMEDRPYIPSAIVKVEAEKAVSRKEINAKIFSDLTGELKTGLEQNLKQIQAPVLIIWGDHDRAINVKNIDKYASLIPNAKKLVLKNIGHLAMIEVPDVTAKAMLDFMPKG